ncbi:MAG TPA: hypothetical protein VFO10_05625 [Oligoflexus sp.]|uniref:hypothetical protein n=1 Tax=Oligoflexus sp. TaxID=1971216 RepID=UPI002D7E202F|nr:hypothetical protein [Oligoflexus sp.]HET9236706.1 hypothetical protein [Oligoflexus sp.]
MGPAKIKRWFEKRGVRINAVTTMKISGTPIVMGYEIAAKNGRNGKLGPNARAHDLENLRREFIKA